MVERPVVRGRILQGTSSKRKRRRCNTTRASISGYSSGKLSRNTFSATAVDAHETGRGIVHRLAEDRPQHQAEEADAERADGAGPRAVIADEARADHHFAAGGLEPLEDAGNIARVVLAVAIDADHVLEAEFVGEFVAGLHAAAETEVVRQGQHFGAGLARDLDGAVGRAIVDHQHRDSGDVLVDFADHAADGAFLVEGGHDDQQGVR